MVYFPLSLIPMLFLLLLTLLLLIQLAIQEETLTSSDSISQSESSKLAKEVGGGENKNVFGVNAILEKAVDEVEDEDSKFTSLRFRKLQVEQNPINRADLNQNSMRSIGTRTGTDKVLHHGYDRYYPQFLRSLRSKPIKMLEIGFLQGHSYEMWVQFFPRGDVYYFEKDHQQPKKPFCHGDQSKIGDLAKCLDEKELRGNLTFIIDDGSHVPEHQIISFMYLFEHGLKSGGIYIIEDIEINYWTTGESYGSLTHYGKDDPKSLMNMLKELVDVVNREFSPPEKRHKSRFGDYIDSWVSSIFFGHNCVIIQKMTDDEYRRYGQRVYRNIDRIQQVA